MRLLHTPPLSALALSLVLGALPAYGQEPRESWRDWATPFEDPLTARPTRLEHAWEGDLLRPPQIPLDELDEDGVIAALDTGDLSCMHVTVATSRFDADARVITFARQDEAQATPAVLSLTDALRAALCYSPEVRATWTAILRASAELGLSRSSYWPTANASVARQHSRLSAAQGRDTIRATSESFTVSWRAFDFGARPARVRAAQAQVQAALAGQSETVRRTAQEVIGTFVQAQALQEQRVRQAEVIALSQVIVASSKRRFAGGVAGRNEVLQAEAGLARANLEQDKIEAELATLQQRLRQLTGLAPVQDFELAPIPAELEVFAEKTTPRRGAQAKAVMAQVLEEWLTMAKQHSPAIVAAAARLDAATASLEATRADAWPRVDVGYSHYRNGRPTQTLVSGSSTERTIGITLTIPLFEGFASTYRVRSAAAEREQAAIELHAAHLEVEKELMDAYAQAQSALMVLDSARNLYQASRELVNSNETLFSQGALNAIEVNRGLLELQTASNELMFAQTRWMSAKLRLWVLSG